MSLFSALEPPTSCAQASSRLCVAMMSGTARASEIRVGAVEGLSQGLYQYGMMTPQNPFLPVVRLPIPTNSRPQPVD